MTWTTWVEELEEVGDLIHALSIDLSNVSVTFAWPDLMPNFSKWQLAVSIGSIGLQNVQKLFNWLYSNYMQRAGESDIKASVDRMLDGSRKHGGDLTDAMVFLPFNVHNAIEIFPAKVLLYIKSFTVMRSMLANYAYGKNMVDLEKPINDAKAAKFLAAALQMNEFTKKQKEIGHRGA